MSKKQITGQDGKQYTVKVKKPFYKKVWFWVLAVVIIFIGVGVSGMGSDDSDTTASTKTEAKSHNTTDKEKGSQSAEKASKSVAFDDDKLDVKESKQVKLNYSDPSWANTKVTIDKAEVDTLVEPYKYESVDDGTFKVNGVVRLHVAITAGQDIEAYPTQGKATLGSEQEEATMDNNWDGEITNGATKEGWVTIPVKNLNNATSARFQFDASYDTDDIDDDNAYKTYDIQLDLQ